MTRLAAGVLIAPGCIAPACVLALVAGRTSAQTLNLGSPQAPDLGGDAAALALAAQLRADAGGITGPGGVASLRRASRTLAASLLEAGQRESLSQTRSTAQRGAMRVLQGRSLANRLDAIDSAIERASGLDDATAAIIASDLARLEADAAQDLESIERGLRLALGPATDLADGEGAGDSGSGDLGGWVSAGPPVDMPAYRTMVSALTASGSSLSTPAARALEEIDDLADRAAAHRSLRRSAMSMRAAVLEAGALATGAGGLPRWMGPTARATMEPAFERALATLADPGKRDQGLADLARHGRLLRLVARTDQLPDDQGGRRARESLSNYLAAPPTNRELEARLLTSYERALDLALAPRTLPDERTLARPVRPAWREFTDSARVAGDRLIDALPTVLSDSAAMTDPGVLALFNGAQRAIDEARGLVEITRLLTGQEQTPAGLEPVPLDEHRALTERLLALSQSASRAGGSVSSEGAAAKRDLGALAIDVSSWRVLPGEGELRDAVATPDPAWTAATEGREHDLLDLVDRTRAALLASVTQDGSLVERAALRARMAMLVDLLTTVREVVATQRMLDGESEGDGPGTPGLGEWSGWELSRPAHRLLAEGLVDALSETVSLALRGEDERARTRIAAIRSDMGAALLPARLYLRWLEVRPESVGSLDDVGLGGPGPGAWMPVDRATAAEFCRVAEELPGIRVRRDDAQDRAVRGYLVMLAQELLAEMK